MRLILIIALSAACLWGGYWFLGAMAVERGLGGWLAERRSDGWVAEAAAIDTIGFPSRFDTTLTDLELADPDTGIAWSAPFFQILALSYEPNRVIAVWPEGQSLATPQQRIEITASRMIGSIAFVPGPTLPLDHSSFELEDFALTSNAGWNARLASGRFATRLSTGKTDSHDVFFEAREFAPSQDLLASIDPAGLLPPVFEAFSLDSTIGFAAPIDRHAIEDGRPRITSIRVGMLSARWGGLKLDAAGTLDIAADGTPTGEITVKARNWKDMLQLGLDNGVIPPAMAGTIEAALRLLAEMSGNPRTLDAPLTFQRGRILLAGIPIGAAPKIVIR